MIKKVSPNDVEGNGCLQEIPLEGSVADLQSPLDFTPALDGLAVSSSDGGALWRL